MNIQALLIMIVLGCLWMLFRRYLHFKKPTLFFSNVKKFESSSVSWRQNFANLPNQLLYAALFFFVAAFLDPHFNTNIKTDKKTLPSEGLAIYLLLDRSGSMRELANNNNTPKIELLKNVTNQFIAGRPNDLLGIVAFARAAQVLSPLTLDHDQLLDQLAQLDVVKNTEDDGTAIGYAIFKTVNMIVATKHFGEELIAKGKPAYTIKNPIMIVVTDGFQFPNPLDKGKRLRNIELDEAAQYAKENGVKIYFINIDPKVSETQYTPQRNQMKRISEMTGGKFFILNKSQYLSEIYSEIDNLEKAPLPKQKSIEYHQFSFYPYLIFLGLICFALGLILNATAFRRLL